MYGNNAICHRQKRIRKSRKVEAGRHDDVFARLLATRTLLARELAMESDIQYASARLVWADRRD
jgi:hypothetical protein